MSVTSPARSLVEKYYGLVDGGRLDDAASLMTENVKLVFGNAEPAYGRGAAAASIAAVVERTDKIQHDVVTWFEKPGTDGATEALFEIRIKYNLKNGNYVDIPGCVYAIVNVDGAFTEQHLYGDLHPVFAD